MVGDQSGPDPYFEQTVDLFVFIFNMKFEKKSSQIENFPIEVLRYIFSFIDWKKNGWFNVLCTCKRFQEIGKEVFNPSLNESQIIDWTKITKPEAVKRLLSDHRYDPTTKNQQAIRVTAAHGHWEVVRELLKDERVDPSASDNLPIQTACRTGHWRVVRELLKDSRVNPNCRNDYPIRWAATRGHLEVVKELLKDDRVDVTSRQNEALRAARLFQHSQIVKEIEAYIEAKEGI